ncbi:MAG: 4-alpha-glucanotransferase [Acidobacteriota bacterium]|nr:4-alpha-glucanotransferase [Acidobacteriota bacterium]
MTRSAGVLLHPTSLPGRYGIGDFGDELIAFLDWARSAGMKIWQLLPLNPPGYGNSPYGCHSSYAGNPLVISPDRLMRDGLLPANALDSVPEFPDEHVEFDRVAKFKNDLLRESWEHFNKHARDDHHYAQKRFQEDNKWLADWAMYAALKKRHNDARWTEWPHAIAVRDPAAMSLAKKELVTEIDYQKYIQFLFFRQWAVIREAADARGIDILGDVPIYVAGDSADVWANRELFQLDEKGEATVVAGVPPDYFSETGQRWGNPLYRWDVLRERKYRWWVSRFRAALRFADIVRIDHFRGFAAYWEIPASEPTAIHGRWMPGPGRSLFDAVRAALGDLPLIAEDLGFITPEVHELREAIGVPGMKILQFAFSKLNSPHLPHCFDPMTVVYTGTHDNDTARGWYASATPEERQLVEVYLGLNGEGPIEWALTRAAFTSVAQTAIVPAQDILGLGSEARMNRPGDGDENWSWRCLPGALTAAHAERLRKLAEITGRV